MIKVAIIIGITRPDRNENRDNAEFKLIDPGDFKLPLTKLHTIKWTETIASFNAYVFRDDGHRTYRNKLNRH